MNYKAVEIKDGNSTELVQYVGVYVLNWKREWGKPEMGFVEIDTEPVSEKIEDVLKRYTSKPGLIKIIVALLDQN